MTRREGMPINRESVACGPQHTRLRWIENLRCRLRGRLHSDHRPTAKRIESKHAMHTVFTAWPDFLVSAYSRLRRFSPRDPSGLRRGHMDMRPPSDTDSVCRLSSVIAVPRAQSS